ncbi:TonB C-terminal domain-containing protein [Lysobacter sp. KIS68-7]|uniref:TonB C-terminal domain-containing protein n=1 Tax=Lysobacter sp. KIS68-7 TaxID=2904252 RepID=UPI0031BB4F19
MWWTRAAAPVNPAGPVIEAELIDPHALSASMRRTLASRPDQPAPVPPQPEEAAPKEQPKPEPKPEDMPQPPQPVAQERVPEPDTKAQEAASKQAISPKPPVDREQEAKRRQEQIDLTERERKDEEERTRRLSEMEKMRQQQIADIRKQRQQAQKEATLAEQKLRQLADARNAADANAQTESNTSPPPGNNGPDNNLKAQYYAAISDAIKRNWTRPDNIPGNVFCPIRIRQVPGGEVIDVEVLPSCPYDEQGRRSVEAAVLKAQPLPYAGFESVFARELTIRFKPTE